jgi:hypothetical protein
MSVALRVVPGRMDMPRPALGKPAEPPARPTLVLVGPEGWPPPRAVAARPVKMLSSYAMREAALGPTPTPPAISAAVRVGLVASETQGTKITMTPANMLFGPEADITEFVVTLLDPGTY